MPFQFRKEAIEENLNSNFPSQGQGNPPLYYSLSEVVVPTYSINEVAEGSGLPENLQTAFDFSTNRALANNATVTIANTPGFYKLLINLYFETLGAPAVVADILIDTGISNKVIYQFYEATSTAGLQGIDSQYMTVFLRSGDTLTCSTNNTAASIVVTSRQIADSNGNLVNPLGFSFA
jgi:hypothetical protein